MLNYLFERTKNYGAVLFEENIAFYEKCGCVPASDFGICYHGFPEGADVSFFLCKELTKGYLEGANGEYATPSGYFVDEQEAEAVRYALP